ncbi:tetratricopeptide repeat protein [Flavobacteriaceae bacterium]|nr:tetratricopeptide repeat protein [Flavobacteriaceae bacterium]
MKKFLKVIKLILTVLFFLYTILILYFLFLSPKETRFDFAGNLQGNYISQTVFNVLKFQYPNYSDAYFEQSVPFNKRGEFARGFELLNKAVQLEPSLHLGYRGYMKLRFLRDYKNALLDFNRLDSLTPNFIDAPWGEDIDFLRGECYYGIKEYSKAIICFKRNIENNKEDWVDINTFVYLGLCEYELGNYEQSILEHQRALKQSANTPEAHFGLAKVYLKLNNLDKAKEHILKAELNIGYKRKDPYKEFQNELFLSEIVQFKRELAE